MAEVSITDIEIELNVLRSRVDAIRGEVTTFLEEVGAPTLVEARDRFRRFATAAIELPRRIESLNDLVNAANKGKEDAQERMQIQFNQAKDLRLKMTAAELAKVQTTAQLSIAKAAMNMAVELLESPMYAALIDDSRPTLRSLDAAIKAVPKDIEE